MKKAVLLHGTDGSSSYAWFPWARSLLEEHGYEVWAPELPESHTPNAVNYERFLRHSGWDFTDNILIGHSSGATTVLNLLSSEGFPIVQKAILVGAFLNEKALPGVEWYEPGQFDNLFPQKGFNVKRIRENAKNIVFIHEDDDPYCLLEDTQQISGELSAELVIVKGGLHLSRNHKELPELLSLI